MADVRVWVDGDVVYVDNGVASVNVINVSSFFFEFNQTKETVTLRDSNDNFKITALCSEVKDESFAPIGDCQTVVDFLESIVSQAASIGLVEEVDDDAINIEGTWPVFINLLYGAFEGEGTEWERIQTDGNGRVLVSGEDFDIRDLTHTTDSVKVGDGTDFLAVESDGSINVNLDVETTRTHNTVSATGVGSVPASICGSVINIGNSAGTWNGISLPAGISIPWSQVANRDTYGAIAYDATGTTFIIEYTT